MTTQPSTVQQRPSAARARLLAGLPVTERRLEPAGIPTAVVEGGSGAPVVLLHGPGEHAAKWWRVLPGLAATHHVVAPDLPGHGASGAAGRPLDADVVCAWLDELIAATCETPPVLVGQILGGAIAARFAARHGDRVRALVLADTLGLAPFGPAPQFGAALMGFIAQPSPETHDELWRHCAHDLDALRAGAGPSWDALREYNLDRAGDPAVRAAQDQLMAAFGLPAIPAAELERIAVPTTLVWGRHDLATPLAVAEAAAERHGWPLHVIDGAADDPPVERPEAFLRVLDAALAQEPVA